MDTFQFSQLLAFILPYLLKGGVELAKSAAGELGKQLSADAWDGLKHLVEKIQQKASARPALQEALTDAQTSPTDPDTQAALRLQLKKLLAEDPALAAEAARLLAAAQSGGHTAINSGDRSVIIVGDANGNVIITGDHNKV